MLLNNSTYHFNRVVLLRHEKVTFLSFLTFVYLFAGHLGDDREKEEKQTSVGEQDRSDGCGCRRRVERDSGL